MTAKKRAAENKVQLEDANKNLKQMRDTVKARKEEVRRVNLELEKVNKEIIEQEKEIDGRQQQIDDINGKIQEQSDVRTEVYGQIRNLFKLQKHDFTFISNASKYQSKEEIKPKAKAGSSAQKRTTPKNRKK